MPTQAQSGPPPLPTTQHNGQRYSFRKFAFECERASGRASGEGSGNGNMYTNNSLGSTANANANAAACSKFAILPASSKM